MHSFDISLKYDNCVTYLSDKFQIILAFAGYYAYTECTGNTHFLRTYWATLTSPEVVIRGDMCVRLSYFMFGSTVQTLRVYMVPVGVDNVGRGALWEISGEYSYEYVSINGNMGTTLC